MSTPEPTLLDLTLTYSTHLLETLRSSLSHTTHTIIYITLLLTLSIPYAYLSVILACTIYFPAMRDPEHEYSYLELFLLSGGIFAYLAGWLVIAVFALWYAPLVFPGMEAWELGWLEAPLGDEWDGGFWHQERCEMDDDEEVEKLTSLLEDWEEFVKVVRNWFRG